MWIFLTPLVKSEINWFYSCKARQWCISFFDSGWQPVKVLWIFHCLKNEAPPHIQFGPPSASFLARSFSSSRLKFFVSVVLPLAHTWCVSCLCFLLPVSLTYPDIIASSLPGTMASHRLWLPQAAQCHRWRAWMPLECLFPEHFRLIVAVVIS